MASTRDNKKPTVSRSIRTGFSGGTSGCGVMPPPDPGWRWSVSPCNAPVSSERRKAGRNRSTPSAPRVSRNTSGTPCNGCGRGSCRRNRGRFFPLFAASPMGRTWEGGGQRCPLERACGSAPDPGAPPPGRLCASRSCTIALCASSNLRTVTPDRRAPRSFSRTDRAPYRSEYRCQAPDRAPSVLSCIWP